MKLIFVSIGAFVALFPMASFVLIALEVVMVYQIAKLHNAVHVGDLVWFCSKMVIISFFLKFFASWLHFIPVLGQIANSAVAAAFIYFVYDVAESHYLRVAQQQR